ncbi:MAG TPA: 4Fe-4S binding protein [Clostridiaceae bacterium]|nr:4Fe-4S binding protein [Clostridiaceae bacterium]
MKRSIIKIDEEKCNGCGICITACAEGALQLVDGKAKLVSESYCDGLGACLPECPTGAISLEEREADPFDEEAVKENMEKAKLQEAQEKAAPINSMACGCPGSLARAIDRKPETYVSNEPARYKERPESQLRQWPCQIKLVSPQAPYFENAHLLVAADCTAFAYANIHEDFIRNKITIIGCPKLDEVDYSEKLAAILSYNNIKSVTVLRMEVPCCGGITNAVKNALIKSGKMIPWSVITVTTDGRILND